MNFSQGCAKLEFHLELSFSPFDLKIKWLIPSVIQVTFSMIYWQKFLDLIRMSDSRTKFVSRTRESDIFLQEDIRSNIEGTNLSAHDVEKRTTTRSRTILATVRLYR
jgi:hypothetical protein